MLAPVAKNVSERTLIGLIGAVQFVNILDFMMVMPLGPDFAVALGIPVSQLGLVGGVYTAAAAVSGLAGAFFLDRFDRKSALLVAMAGLVIGTAAGAFATDLTTLIASRVVAGLFGGPATSVSLSIISDVIPPARRGRAMGSVMGAFSIASILGVPLGLELARLGGWRAPFVGVALLGVAVIVIAAFMMPSMRGHIASEKGRSVGDLTSLFRRPIVILAYAALGISMMSAFALIPNISAHVQQNLHYPREKLGVLYLVGGAVSFVSMRFAGRFVDRVGSFRVNAVGVLAFGAVVYAAFVMAEPPLPLTVVFAVFMVAQTTRNVALTALISKVPEPHERAGFMSVQSAVQHLASALGAGLSSKVFLHDGPNGALLGMHELAIFSIVLAALTPPIVLAVERRVRSAP